MHITCDNFQRNNEQLIKANTELNFANENLKRSL